jgi:hypothetical protein
LRHAGEVIGLGVFATAPIPQGTIVWVLDELDQILPAERVKRLGRRYGRLLDRYAFVNGKGEQVVCWDLARWINHSCDANVISSGWNFDVAIRDIAAGEEITNDYAALNLDASFTCHCGNAGCRGRIRPRDFPRLSDRWDAAVRAAFPKLLRVEQPLWEWVPSKRSVAAAARDPRRVPSIRTHFYQPEEAQPHAPAAGAGS